MPRKKRWHMPPLRAGATTALILGSDRSPLVSLEELTGSTDRTSELDRMSPTPAHHRQIEVNSMLEHATSVGILLSPADDPHGTRIHLTAAELARLILNGFQIAAVSQTRCILMHDDLTITRGDVVAHVLIIFLGFDLPRDYLSKSSRLRKPIR